MDKSYGGADIKDLASWNKAIIAKLVWAVAKKKDVLWVKWVHERYIKDKNWWEYKPPHDSSWYWKKTCRVKEEFKRGCTEPLSWDWEGGSEYKVSKGYAWLKQPQRKNPWAKII